MLPVRRVRGVGGQSLRLKCVPWMNLPLLLCRPSAENTFSTLSSLRLQKEELLTLGVSGLFLCEDNDGKPEEYLS